MPDPLRLAPVDAAVKFLREKGWQIAKADFGRDYWKVVRPNGEAVDGWVGSVMLFYWAENRGFVTPKGVEEGAG